MLYKIHCAFILVASVCSFVAATLKLQVDGRMEFGPKWNYDYRIKPIETSSDKPKILQQRVLSDISNGPHMIDIIIKNDHSNPSLVQVAEARIYDKKYKLNISDKAQLTEKDSKAETNQDKAYKRERPKVSVDTKKIYPVWSSEHTIPPITNIKLSKTGKNVRHLVRMEDNESHSRLTTDEFEESDDEQSDKDNFPIATVMEPRWKEKRKHTVKNPKRKNDKHTEDEIETGFRQDGTKMKDAMSIDKTVKSGIDQDTTIKYAKAVTIAAYAPPATEMVDAFNNTDMYIKPRLVKYDKKIRDFTKHIYEQSIKVFEGIKDKMPNDDMKTEAERLMRSYEDKFGDFVRETQSQEIRTRLGTQKVILNTLDTSNRILERLAHHLIGKMDGKGYLRIAGGENFILNEINKKKELEDKHICKKLLICRSKDSFTEFIIDILSIISSADDKSINEMRDACTEVLKNIDYTNSLDPDTENRFLKGISDLESYDSNTMRSLFLIMKNILKYRNTPIKVVGQQDSRVNKTIAFLEMVHSWDTKLPPNENNVLEWNELRNNFRDWKEGSKKDSVHLVQRLADLVMGVNVGRSDGTSRTFDININTILGF